MALTEARKKANAKYTAKAYDDLKLRVKKGQSEVIKAHAKAQGKSLNGYINDLIAQDMGTAESDNSKLD